MLRRFEADNAACDGARQPQQAAAGTNAAAADAAELLAGPPSAGVADPEFNPLAAFGPLDADAAALQEMWLALAGHCLEETLVRAAAAERVAAGGRRPGGPGAAPWPGGGPVARRLASEFAGRLADAAQPGGGLWRRAHAVSGWAADAAACVAASAAWREGVGCVSWDRLAAGGAAAEASRSGKDPLVKGPRHEKLLSL
jgi:hypothetical protein